MNHLPCEWMRQRKVIALQPTIERVGIIRSILLTDDRNTDWPVIRATEKYRMQLYKRFPDEGGNTLEHEGEPVPQTWIVGSVDECVEQLQAFIDEFGLMDIISMAAPPGLRIDRTVGSLEKLFGEVVPKLKSLRKFAREGSGPRRST